MSDRPLQTRRSKQQHVSWSHPVTVSGGVSSLGIDSRYYNNDDVMNGMARKYYSHNNNDNNYGNTSFYCGRSDEHSMTFSSNNSSSISNDSDYLSFRQTKKQQRQQQVDSAGLATQDPNDNLLRDYDDDEKSNSRNSKEEEDRRKETRGRFLAIMLSLAISLLIAIIVTHLYNFSLPIGTKNNHRLKTAKPILRFRLEQQDNDRRDHVASATTAQTKNFNTPNYYHHYSLYKFKIVQLADLHLGESTMKDQRTYDLIDGILRMEAPVDLIVLSGDQISAEYCPNLECAKALYEQLGTQLSKYKIPWALVFGDTDDDNAKGITRQHLIEIDQSFDYSLSLSSLSSPTINNSFNNFRNGNGSPRGIQLFGTSNYLLNIFAPPPSDNAPESTGKNTASTTTTAAAAAAAAQIYFLDSGGGSLPKKLEQSQVSWFQQTNQRLPAVAFQHIPTSNFHQAEKCIGYRDYDHIDPDYSGALSSTSKYDTNIDKPKPKPNKKLIDTIDFDPGIVDAMSESTRISFLAAGHGHGNHYCCPFSRWLSVCLGARTGYGGEGVGDDNTISNDSGERGARVYELSMEDPTLHKLEWKSWVRLESGDAYDQVSHYDLRTELG